MKRFLLSISKFAIPLIIGILLIEILLQILPGEYGTKFTNFLNQRDSTEILILGNSHTLRGINPHKFNYRAYSMAMVSQALQIDYEILIDNKNEIPNLKAVIIPISYFTLSKRLNEGELLNRLPFYESFYGLEFDELNGFDLKSNSLQLSMGIEQSIEFIGKYLLKGKKSVVKCDEFGWLGVGGPKCATKKDFENHARKVIKNHEDGSTDFEENIKRLVEIASWGEENGVYILLVNTPKTTIYNSELNSAKLNLINSEMLKLSKNYKMVDYLNFSEDEGFEISEFRNSDHLNNKGASKFTSKLDSIVSRKLNSSTLTLESQNNPVLQLTKKKNN